MAATAHTTAIYDRSIVFTRWRPLVAPSNTQLLKGPHKSIHVSQTAYQRSPVSRFCRTHCREQQTDTNGQPKLHINTSSNKQPAFMHWVNHLVWLYDSPSEKKRNLINIHLQKKLPVPESISVNLKVWSSTILTQNRTASYICATKVTKSKLETVSIASRRKTSSMRRLLSEPNLACNSAPVYPLQA